MGQDIQLNSDISELYQELTEGQEEVDFFQTHSLSRTFCFLMERKDHFPGEPEFDQIARLAGVDIEPLYQMEHFPDAEGMEALLELAADEEERQRMLEEAAEEVEALGGNLETVLDRVNTLLREVPKLGPLPELLAPTPHDSLGRPVYFADFNENPGDGYLRNNFGQDLRNFKTYLEFIQQHGATTVWFVYG